MLLRIILIALALPVLAVLIVLGVDTVRNLAGSDREPDSGVGAVMPPGPSPELPELEFDTEWEGLSDAEWAAIDRTAERIGSTMLESINDDFRASIDAGISQRASPLERNQQLLDEMNRYRRDPAWPTGPAVPGVAGFEIQQCPETRTCLSDLLRDETDDPAWSRPMEARIMGELAGQAAGGVAQVHVACRQTICGVLLPSASGDSRVNLVQVGERLAAALGFAGHTLADRTNFQAIYLSVDEVPGSMWMQ
jgi:hypothetical protein